MTTKNILKLRRFIHDTRLSSLAQVSPKYKEDVESKMLAWQIHSYGDLNELKVSNVRIPIITNPTEVLIKVQAASVNPIDIAMIRGYGATLLNLMRKARNFGGYAYSDLIEFPLTLGRDFSGIVVSKGHNVGDKLRLGDQVWGIVPVDKQGCHANYVVVDSSLVNQYPKNLSYIEAASVLYAGLTAWSALWITGGLCYKTSIGTRLNRRMLVLGGSGGVGTMAIQLLKAWNMHVITTCSSDAVNMVEKLGANVVIDYKQRDADAQIISEGPYDIILDCSNQGPDLINSKGYPYYTYITLNSPLLKNIDQLGLIAGTFKNLGDIFKYNIPKSNNKGSVKWGLFVPSETGMSMLHDFVECGQIVPVVKQIYPFQDLPAAYERVTQGHLRGKLVIDMK
ncbi:hypothetical protein V1477_000809 [Vespula maculifrons]|uniref:Enoyl reductase (ER) domain-containing protein n=3 Tax=Vespula TaxID=7451 RepID=A0A834JBU3_VESGE|nr:reticulon-4-interacting protein 1, mitochondrial [Vespula pensylvanica]XP_050862946.1 reticulon-4-interacting protein 1, mitochondrial [Vespula vulgaris]KAF7385313.1 hypothetical protein HZH68_013743 [Vespula germanica]KAF7404123.1 hypothetical protein H0235_014817 [Vespula pensylvanica]